MTDRSSRSPRPGLLPTSRLEAFSDGVFAIAITLLVLDLKVPEGGDLVHELGTRWPSFVSYLVSFAFIGGAWMAHSTLTKFLKASDQVLMGLNLVLLLFVSLLPFTTALMATHLEDSVGEKVAAVAFGLNLTLASLTVDLMLRYVAGTPDLADESADEEISAFARRRRWSLVVQAAATAIALVAPYVAVTMYLLISVVVLVEPIARARRRVR